MFNPTPSQIAEAARFAAEEDADEPLWLCVCGEVVESEGCCPQCSNEPPWGCDCEPWEGDPCD